MPRRIYQRITKLFSRPLTFLLFFPIVILYMELIAKAYCFGSMFSGFFYTLLFTLPIGLLIALLSSLWKPKVNRIVSIVCMVIVTIAIYGQLLYYTIFKTFLVLYSFTATAQTMEYWQEAVAGIWKSIPILILLLIPLIVWIVFGKQSLPRRRPNLMGGLIFAGVIIVLQFVATFAVQLSTGGIMSIRYLYYESFTPDLTVRNFGVLTTWRLDARNLLFGLDSGSYDPDADPSISLPSENPDTSAAPIVYKDNVMEIDFDALIANTSSDTIKDMHEYFKNVTPTKQNEYTGMWEGKNIIWICAEGFSTMALDKDLTPTLYKLSNEGFVFTDFYNPVWGVSTSDGEYVTLTGLIPKSGIRSFAKSAENYMPFCFGNQLSPLNYKTLAYHNHTYTFYGRDQSHPNMGYTYKGIGNGLEVRKTWPESDLEMVEVTLPEFIDDDPFHVYYMTVSGHLLYTYSGNFIANKNKELVEHLPYSETIKAYLACNIELDLAMQALIEALDDAGILEDTAIVLSGDHYPYGLEWEGLDALNEFAGHTVERNFELYESTLIMWAGDMEDPIVIDKPCSALDILPTLSNLMGLEYDSRLLMGTDILSDAPRLVVFSNRSWITDYGRYDSTTGEFSANEGVDVSEDYARSIMKVVNNKFDYSRKILENDYYKIALS